MNRTLEHVLLCALGCQSVLLMVGLPYLPLEGLATLSGLIQFPTALIVAWITPPKPMVSFLIGVGFAVLGGILFLFYLASQLSAW